MAALTEYDLDIADTTMRCHDGGEGFPLIFVHGSGPGVDTISNFGRLLPRLAERYRVVAFDLIGFGRSGRKQAPPYFDMQTWVSQVARVIEHLGVPRVGLVGHSLGGPIVLEAAAELGPDVVVGTIVTGTMGVPPTAYSSGGPRWKFPDSPDLILQHVRRTMFDPSTVDPGEVDRRIEVLYADGYREYFEQMFADADQCLVDSVISTSTLDKVTQPVALLHGRFDKSYPADESSLVLARYLARAEVQILDRCAHSVAHERPDAVEAVVDQLFGDERRSSTTA